jgi:ATP-dependent Lhr-like helicase
VLQRLELRGEVRRGYFVAGLSGAQFALPDAVERLREAPDEAVIVLNATDPANVFGGALGEAPRFARVPSTHLALLRGQPVMVFEDRGNRITTLPDVPPEVLERAFQAYLTRPHAPSRIVVSEWNGARVSASAGQAMLRAIGFKSTPAGMEWWASAQAPAPY